VVDSLQKGLCALPCNHTPKSDPLLRKEEDARIAIDVTSVWVDSICVTQRDSKILWNQGCGSFHCKPATSENDLTTHREHESSVFASSDDPVAVHPMQSTTYPLTRKPLCN